jgi:hypothetical protein
MRQLDQQRLAKLVGEFVDSCGLDPPLYVIAIGLNGSVSVSRHSNRDVEQVCGHNVARMTAPITVAVIGSDGSGRSARIEMIEATRERDAVIGAQFRESIIVPKENNDRSKPKHAGITCR